MRSLIADIAYVITLLTNFAIIAPQKRPWQKYFTPNTAVQLFAEGHFTFWAVGETHKN
jgi:hypothetical protein